MKIVVTGSHGQIGKELVKLLDNHDVLEVDKKIDKNLNDPEVRTEIEIFKPEVVFHLAASFDRLNEPPGFERINWEDNILATHHLIESMGKPEQVVFASSYLVYDRVNMARPASLYEGSAICPRNLIGASKLYSEKLLDFVCPNVAHARIFRVYSKDSHSFVNHFVNTKKHGGKVNVWNTDGAFDLIHAKDVASALLTLFDSKVSGVYNVGTGVPHTVQDVIDMVGVEVVRAEDMARTERTYASIGKIKGLGWEPRVSLAEGIRGLQE